jgi:sec-independent protein translocase protein TatC
MDRPAKVDLFKHLAELRQRLMRVAWALMAGTALGYWQSSRALVWLTRPLVHLYRAQALPPTGGPLNIAPPADPSMAHQAMPLRRFIYTGLTEAFLTHLKMALFVGLLVAAPVIAYQVWQFVRPALPQRARAFYAGLISLAPGLFAAGAGLAYGVICPKAWAFFLSFEETSNLGIPLHFEAKLSDYVALTLKLMMGFGVAFQVPIAMALAVSTGWVQLDTLRRGRKYAFLIITIVAAIATPPDLISPLGLMIPVYGLYELTLWGLRWVETRSDRI